MSSVPTSMSASATESGTEGASASFSRSGTPLIASASFDNSDIGSIRRQRSDATDGTKARPKSYGGADSRRHAKYSSESSEEQFPAKKSSSRGGKNKVSPTQSLSAGEEDIGGGRRGKSPRRPGVEESIPESSRETPDPNFTRSCDVTPVSEKPSKKIRKSHSVATMSSEASRRSSRDYNSDLGSKASVTSKSRKNTPNSEDNNNNHDNDEKSRRKSSKRSGRSSAESTPAERPQDLQLNVEAEVHTPEGQEAEEDEGKCAQAQWGGKATGCSLRLNQ